MAESRNTFIKSKMNKDLDDRIIPKGEYRDGQNVSVSRSENADVGALENTLGNLSVTQFGLSDSCGLEIIGYIMDEANNRLFAMITNYTDNSPTTLSNPAYVVGATSVDANTGGECYIVVYEETTNNGYVITSGSWLNFSKTHPITGINLIEDSLFWTDNRNQPRKINVTNAITDASYYWSEDHVSVAKLYPWEPIALLVNNSGTLNTTMKDVTSSLLPDGATVNPYVDATWAGNAEYLRDRFVRFSYRFKFDDNEYSLIAPFTQICFVPEQDGYFIGDDEAITFKSTDLDIMRNKIDSIEFQIPSPSPIWGGTIYGISPNQGAPLQWQYAFDFFKITEIDILYKEANGLAIKVVDTLTKDNFIGNSTNYISYLYDGKKPFKVLPNKEITRVYDQVPIRALAQEISGNRVIYGNYIDKHTAPGNLNYNVQVAARSYTDVINATYPEYTNNNGKEYQNHTLKQNRTYQAAIVLCDRYGRQSNPILSIYDNDTTNQLGSTVFHPYKNRDFTNAQATTGTWIGDELDIVFYSEIPESIEDEGYPGWFRTQPNYTSQFGYYRNAVGWHSMKVVVKQTEQDYYNVYFPGIMNMEDFSTASASDTPTLFMVTQSDNINKIPRSLGDIGPDQKIFRTSKPRSIEGDKAYVKEWLMSAGFAAIEYDIIGQGADADIDFDMDQPEIKELLAERERLEIKDFLVGKDNSSVQMYLRVQNHYRAAVTPPNWTTQFWPLTSTSGTIQNPPDDVILIGKGTELGLWETAGPADPAQTQVFDQESNPHIAKISCNSWTSSDDPGSDGTNVTKMIPMFSVYETTPTESNLDIYWETTTAYSLHQLNYNIGTSDTTSPTSIVDSASYTAATTTPGDWSNPIGNLHESSTGNDDLVGDVVITNDNIVGPGKLTDTNLVLTSVIDGLGTDVTSNFTITEVGATDVWQVKNVSYVYSSPTASRFLTVNVKATSDYGTPAISVTKPFSFIAEIKNIKSVLIAPAGVTQSVSGDNDGDLLYTLEARNGCADPTQYSKDLQYQIEYQKIQGTSTAVNHFYLVTDPTEGKIQLWNYPMTAAEANAGPFELIVRVKDRPAAIGSWISGWYDAVIFTATINVVT